MRRNLWVFLVSVFLIGVIGACVSEVEEENVELHPTFLLTPYATDTLTPTITPPVPPTFTPTPTPETMIYTVAPGDTLSGISARYNVSVQELRVLNGLSSDILSVGQELRIPKQ